MKPHSERVQNARNEWGKWENYIRNEWERYETTLETSGEDAKTTLFSSVVSGQQVPGQLFQHAMALVVYTPKDLPPTTQVKNISFPLFWSVDFHLLHSFRV